jgi:hypothetical protein
MLTSLDPTSLDPTSLDPTSLDPTSLDPTSLDPTSLDHDHCELVTGGSYLPSIAAERDRRKAQRVVARR